MGTTFLVVGAHILDVLVRPVDHIPPGQGSLLVEDAILTPAGTAAATAVALARLGGQVSTVGVVGSDLCGALLLQTMAAEGVDVSRVRCDPVTATSLTVLPIRPNGERPALHFPGANVRLSSADIPWDLVEASDYVHVGGCDRLPAASALFVAEVLRRAHAAGATTSMDVLNPGSPESFEHVSRSLPYTDYFLPNADQALALTGTGSLPDAAEAILAAGARAVVLTQGADGCTLVSASQRLHQAAIPVEVTDTTGCGDAFTAAFLRALSLGEPLDEALRLSAGAGALVAGGLGSNANLRNMGQLRAFAAAKSHLHQQTANSACQ